MLTGRVQPKRGHRKQKKAHVAQLDITPASPERAVDTGEPGHTPKVVHELKFAALFRPVDPALCKVVVKAGGRFVVKLRKGDASVERGATLSRRADEEPHL